MTPSPSVVLFSHLDGTPFDPYLDSSPAPAGTVRPLVRHRIPVVFFSSRTRAELELIQQQLGLRHPFVAENGSALYVPRGYFGFDVPGACDVAGYESVTYGRPYHDIVAAMRTTAKRLGIRIVGFSDLSVSEVARESGLTPLQARLAKLRDHGEVCRVTDANPDAPARLAKALRGLKLRCASAGRFMHVGADTDQGAIVDFLLALYRRALPAPITVGMGEPVADLALLRRMDVAIIGETRPMDPGPHDDRAASLERLDGRVAAVLEVLNSARSRVD